MRDGRAGKCGERRRGAEETDCVRKGGTKKREVAAKRERLFLRICLKKGQKLTCCDVMVDD